MNGKVAGIFIASAALESPQAVDRAVLVAGGGVVGDRYHGGRGTFSAKLDGRPDRELTMIEAEEIDRFNEVTGSRFGYGDFRRNIVTAGARLNELQGRSFSVGGAIVEGIRLCEPCRHLAGLLAPEVMSVMVHRAGLRARIVAGGVVRVGDPVAGHAV